MAMADLDEQPTSTEPPDERTDDEPRERLSWGRVGIVLIVAAVIAGGVVLTIDRAATDPAPIARSWSVPYVDVTLTPTYQFQDPQLNPARDIALAFVVAHPDDPCTPSWGGAYTLDEASRDLELDRRITQLRAAGGDIMVSFGGQANQELAFACDDVAKLTAAYQQVIDRYDVSVIDLDIENADIADTASIERRARALAAVQQARTDAGDELAVWLTLPVARSGLTADGVALVRSTLAGGIELTGVNVMTMNFGDSSSTTPDMLAATKSALEATADQVADAWASHGMTLDSVQRWAHLGATPMIGQNDVVGEVFTLDDAAGLAEFAESRGLGRVSTWSLNRDTPCGSSFADVTVLSNTCSSIEQDPLAFANVFTTLPGRAPSLPQTDTVTVVDRTETFDDASTSPYPIWRPEAQYPEGYKTVRRGMVYEAKWYTQGQDPAMVVANPWETPWSLIGPVGPDEEPFVPTTVAPGTHPDWSPKQLYATGDRVLLGGLPYEARWPNQGEVPPSLFPVDPDSAWEPLFAIPGEPTSS